MRYSLVLGSIDTIHFGKDKQNMSRFFCLKSNHRNEADKESQCIKVFSPIILAKTDPKNEEEEKRRVEARREKQRRRREKNSEKYGDGYRFVFTKSKMRLITRQSSKLGAFPKHGATSCNCCL